MKVISNKFFQLAITRATRFSGKPGRLLALLAQLAIKLYPNNNLSFRADFRERFSVIGRFIRAIALGNYKLQSPRIFIIVLAAVIYFLNPFDLIPDFVLGLGLSDDLAVLTWVYRASQQELDSFLRWEQSSVLNIPVQYTFP
jgi:uncharacterized membrane protein YkvA (DUF1232 family)